MANVCGVVGLVSRRSGYPSDPLRYWRWLLFLCPSVPMSSLASIGTQQPMLSAILKTSCLLQGACVAPPSQSRCPTTAPTAILETAIKAKAPGEYVSTSFKHSSDRRRNKGTRFHDQIRTISDSTVLNFKDTLHFDGFPSSTEDTNN